VVKIRAGKMAQIVAKYLFFSIGKLIAEPISEIISLCILVAVSSVVAAKEIIQTAISVLASV